MSDTPRLLRYTRMSNRTLHDNVLWVAITSGSPGRGGQGIVTYGRVSEIVGRDNVVLEPELGPGDPFSFAANKDFAEGGIVGGRAEREVWGLDAAPPEVAAAWMKLKHQGKLG